MLLSGKLAWTLLVLFPALAKNNPTIEKLVLRVLKSRSSGVLAEEEEEAAAAEEESHLLILLYYSIFDPTVLERLPWCKSLVVSSTQHKQSAIRLRVKRERIQIFKHAKNQETVFPRQTLIPLLPFCYILFAWLIPATIKIRKTPIVCMYTWAQI